MRVGSGGDYRPEAFLIDLHAMKYDGHAKGQNDHCKLSRARFGDMGGLGPKRVA